VSPPTNSDLEKERQTQSQREKKKKKDTTPRIVELPETIPLFPRLPPAVYYFFDSPTPTNPKTNKTYNAFE
jgi:hypothetical protein